jgi:hypothetical protein
MLRTSPTHIYYNVRIQNGNPDGQDKICDYREQRTVPIMNNPSEYFMSCIRFQVPTSRVPILLVPVQPFPNTDTTKTIYAVTLSYNGVSVTRNIVWQPHEGNSHSTPPVQARRLLSANSAYTNPEDSYYYCRSYRHMMGLVNDAFQSAFTELAGQTTLPANSEAPFYTFDSASSLFSLHALKNFYDVKTVTNPIKIYLNNDLFTLFGAMDAMLYRLPVGEMDRQILIASNADGSNIDADGHIKFTQEYPTLVSWVGFTSIVITSGTIPIESEGIPTSLPYFSNTNLQATGQPSFLNIISDFDALLDQGYREFQTSLQYSASAEYRLIDMIGTQPLTSFDIQVWWTDAFGGLHPVYIAPNECATFKFLFRKRSYGITEK